ncbi:hypothetical protein BDQ17DRAFT_1092205 [Cyathus striatus]|nr:hypothetical protein BDQ17DRAFT_1092205 [Cyathus striatus]
MIMLLIPIEVTRVCRVLAAFVVLHVPKEVFSAYLHSHPPTAIICPPLPLFRHQMHQLQLPCFQSHRYYPPKSL